MLLGVPARLAQPVQFPQQEIAFRPSFSVSSIASSYAARASVERPSSAQEVGPRRREVAVRGQCGSAASASSAPARPPARRANPTATARLSAHHRRRPQPQRARRTARRSRASRSRPARRLGVHGGDRGLQGVALGGRARSASRTSADALRDLAAVPPRPVLLGEQQQPPVRCRRRVSRRASVSRISASSPATSASPGSSARSMRARSSAPLDQVAADQLVAGRRACARS